ncbi:hypothetical protein F4780DRAFT_727538 [Xylariomycetidae sp. FL0641]|nr:hypothetical protein F4780DRAFT_727538 [Xylariomycetidae sp. FL0641]
MPRKKTPTKPGKPKGRPPLPPPRRRNAPASLVREFSGGTNSPAAGPHRYSLAEEARNTAHNRRGFRGQDAKLRYNPVQFVSAGFMDPLKLLEPTNQAPEEAKTVSEEVGQEAPTDVASRKVVSDQEREDLESSHQTTEEPVAQPTGARSVDMGPPEPVSNQEDTGPGSELESEDEVILFKGRNVPRQPPTSMPITRVDGPTEHKATTGVQVEPTTTRSPSRGKSPKPPVEEESADFIAFGHPKPKRKSSHKPIRYDSDDEDAAIMADYMANLQAFDEDREEGEEGDEDDEGGEKGHAGIGSSSFNILRDLGGTDSEAIPELPTSDDDSDDDGRGNGDEEGEDNEASRRRQREWDDERFARLLAKSEELGLDPQLMLYDDHDDMDDELFANSQSTPRRKKAASKKDKIFQKRGQYPSASQVADAFDDLDLMDWHRPSLNNFAKKGAKSFNVSDSELEEALNMAWKKDRLKKADKKKAREELRSQGLLGKNVNPDDLRVKYRGGMSLDDLANEIESFLLGSQEQLILPPFDKGARKTIHAVANKFKLKSQSAGKGKNRYPVLYRSRATLPFDPVVFDRVFGRIHQNWFSRVDVDEEVVAKHRMLKRAEASSGKQPSRFGKRNPLHLREGDVVGQHAAELGAENKGRAMLEKMGWSKGQSLGTDKNKGILVPVTQVVKKTKAGLGDA